MQNAEGMPKLDWLKKAIIEALENVTDEIILDIIRQLLLKAAFNYKNYGKEV